MSITNLLYSSKLGLFANQSALNAVSHNIANVNTPGYSRQTVSLEANPGAAAIPGRSGEGVLVADLKRQVDALVDKRLRLGMEESGRLESRDRFLGLMEDVFNDLDGEGFSSRMESFFQSVDAAADNPINPVARAQVVASAEDLSLFATKMQTSLEELALPVDQEVTNMLDQINSTLGNLEEINGQIVAALAAGGQPLDLQDQRQQLVQNLSRMLDVQVLDGGNGGISVLSGSGQLLLDQSFRAVFSRSEGTTTAAGFQGIAINGEAFDYTDLVHGGSLKGLLEIRDQTIHGENGYLTRLESLVDEIRFQTNLAHVTAVPQNMLQELTGVMNLGNDLTTVMGSLVTDPTSSDYLDSPTDLGRTEIQAGTITFARGSDSDNLTTVTVTVDPATQSLTDLVTAIGTATGMSAEITANNRLRVYTTDGTEVFGVVSDTSNVLAALGVGALFGGNGARDMTVNQDLLADTNRLGISRVDVSSGTPVFDDASNAGILALGALRSTKFTIGGNMLTFSSHYADIAGDLGVARAQNEESMAAQESSAAFLQDVRDSISGVSLEEELTDLVKFQRAFQASSRMVSVADELLETIIGMI
ncbi:MAG: flagellar hook-associated protein FlgK [Magnetococcales bacterium]|nr:flagellar hook-associated protein FlgK [Magnetococcales bacterium]